MLGLGMLSKLARESRGDAIGEKGESSVSDDCAIIADCACDEEEAAAAEVLLLLSVLLGAVTARVGVCATSCVALGGPSLLAAASPMSAVVPPSPAAPSPSSISRTNKRKSGATVPRNHHTTTQPQPSSAMAAAPLPPCHAPVAEEVSSASNFFAFATTNIELDLRVDFGAQSATARH